MVGYNNQNAIFERKIQTITLGAGTLLLNEKKLARGNTYNVIALWTEGFSEQLIDLKVDDYGINPMDKFSGTTTYITLKNHHTWGCPV